MTGASRTTGGRAADTGADGEPEPPDCGRPADAGAPARCTAG
ncbi:hypothetical protein AB0D10_44780 [Kitasatospora sp. NPDC048545]